MDQSLHTLFFAQVMGLYLVIMGIIMLSRASYYREMIRHLKVGSSTIVLASVAGLIMGISLVLVHNLWTWQPEVLVTLVAWGILIKSICWLSFPEYMVNMTQKMYSGWGYYTVIAVAGIVGMVLMTHGFYLFM